MSEAADHLRNYAASGDERAFRALVDAHLGMVFGTAMRRTGDRALSEEIAQNVFNSLAKKAGEIRSAAALPAWLHRAAVLECSNAIRGESRRRQRMQKLIEITALEGEGLAAWKHAAPDLDEAVDELPAADREILFQRFYQDKSFREIARASGKSEAASQKQASRALHKLGELMRARGFAVPVAVLAAGLGSELCKAAPAGLAATISNTALATAGASAAAATTSSGLFAAMSITKSTAAGVAAAVLLIAVFTSGGYLSGRSAAKAERAAKAANPKPSSPGAVIAKGGGGAGVTATPQGPRGSVREILQAAAGHFANLGKDDEAGDKAEREIATLRLDEIAAALKEIAMLETDDASRDRTRWEILKHWARSDGPAAAAFAFANPDGKPSYVGITSALIGWAGLAPVEAYAWYRENVAGADIGAEARRYTLRSVIRTWATVDPGAALAELAHLPYDDQRTLARSFDELIESEDTRARYLDALQTFPDDNIRSQMVEDAVDKWSRRDPTAAAAWFDQLEFEKPESAFKPASELAENWFQRDPGAAVEWFWPKVPEAMREEFLEELIREEWAKADPEDAAAWLKAKGYE